MSAYPSTKLSSAATSPATLIRGAWNQNYQQIFALGMIVTFSSGASLTCSVQITADDPNGAAGLVNWNNHDTLVNLTSSANGNVAYGITAYRLVVTNYVSGSVNLGVAQWP